MSARVFAVLVSVGVACWLAASRESRFCDEQDRLVTICLSSNQGFYGERFSWEVGHPIVGTDRDYVRALEASANVVEFDPFVFVNSGSLPRRVALSVDPGLLAEFGRCMVMESSWLASLAWVSEDQVVAFGGHKGSGGYSMTFSVGLERKEGRWETVFFMVEGQS